MGLKKRQLYEIMKKVKTRKNVNDQRPFISKKMVGIGQIMASVANTIKAGRHVPIEKLTAIHMTSFRIISPILHKELGLVENLALWMLKLSSQKHGEMHQGLHKAYS
jgi:hypothetical protein